MYCEYCKAKFRLKENIINHINIVQEIQTHNFCSKRCKEAWQKDVSESNLRKIIVWDVSSKLGTFHFKRGTEYDYLSPFAIKYSYFSKDLGSINNIFNFNTKQVKDLKSKVKIVLLGR